MFKDCDRISDCSNCSIEMSNIIMILSRIVLFSMIIVEKTKAEFAS